MKLPEFIVGGPAQSVRLVSPEQAGAVGRAIAGDVGRAAVQVGDAALAYQRRIKAERTAHEAAITDAYVEGEMSRWTQDYDREGMSGREVERLLGGESGVATTEPISTDTGEVEERERIVPRREWYPQAWEKKYRSVIDVASKNISDPALRQRFEAAAYADMETQKAALFRQGEAEARDERKRTEVALIDRNMADGNFRGAQELAASSQYLSPGEVALVQQQARAGEEMWGWREVLLSGTDDEKARLAKELRSKDATWLNKPEHVVAIANALEADVKSAASAPENTQKAYSRSVQVSLSQAVRDTTGPARTVAVKELYNDIISDPAKYGNLTDDAFKWIQKWHDTNGFMESSDRAIAELETLGRADLAEMPDDTFAGYLLELNPEDQRKWDRERIKAQSESTGRRVKEDEIKAARNSAFEQVYGGKPSASDDADEYKAYVANRRAFNGLVEEELQLAIDENGGRDLTLRQVNEVLDGLVIAGHATRERSWLWDEEVTMAPEEIYLPLAQRALKAYNRAAYANSETQVRATNRSLWLMEMAAKQVAEKGGDITEAYKSLDQQWQEATR